MSDIHILSVAVRVAKVPLPEPHRTASAVISESPLVLIDVTASDGTVGHGLLFTYTPAALGPTAQLVENIAPLLENQSLAPKQLSLELAAKFRLLGTQGIVGMALAGIDMALWDCLARCHHLSLVTLLGGNSKAVKPYGAVGFDGIKGSARAAENLAKQGFLGVKAKIGYPTLSEDLETIRAMRSAVGDDFAIMVDYNQSLDPAEALRRLCHLDDEGLTWIEEPIKAIDYSSYKKLAAAFNTPIQCGENWWGIADMQHSLCAEASNLVMPDVMKIGGVTGWLEAAALAAAHNIPMSNHLWPELSARLMSVTPTAHWLEYSDWWNPILQEPLQIERGYTVMDHRLGSGIEWDEEVICKYVC
ncbi:MAG: hypothetical protein KTR18_11230 [Acidiferrobacterales bacterium]|nr:hypothetical protein [Acidiferrobacterales bacterium]